MADYKRQKVDVKVEDLLDDEIQEALKKAKHKVLEDHEESLGRIKSIFQTAHATWFPVIVQLVRVLFDAISGRNYGIDIDMRPFVIGVLFGFVKFANHGASIIRAVEIAWPDVYWNAVFSAIDEASSDMHKIYERGVLDVNGCSLIEKLVRAMFTYANKNSRYHHFEKLTCTDLEYDYEKVDTSGTLFPYGVQIYLDQASFTKFPTAAKNMACAYIAAVIRECPNLSDLEDNESPLSVNLAEAQKIITVPEFASQCSGLPAMMGCMLWPHFKNMCILMMRPCGRVCCLTLVPLSSPNNFHKDVKAEFDEMKANGIDNALQAAVEEVRARILTKNGEVDPALYKKWVQQGDWGIKGPLKADGPLIPDEYKEFAVNVYTEYGRTWLVVADGSKFDFTPGAVSEHMRFLVEHRKAFTKEEALDLIKCFP